MNFFDELYIQLVTLPYNLLLQRSAREALGIDLKDQIVIVDEGHSELIPCFVACSSFTLLGSSLTLCRSNSYPSFSLHGPLLSLPPADCLISSSHIRDQVSEQAERSQPCPIETFTSILGRIREVPRGVEG